MNLSDKEINSIKKIFAVAERESLQIFQAPVEEQKRDWKEDFSVVSRADKLLEEIFRNELYKIFPNIALLGEESGGRITAPSWVLDPIDGSSSFISGLPLWSISLGLIDENALPAHGFLSIPNLNKLIWQNGAGQLMDNNRLVPKGIHGMQAHHKLRKTYFHKESQIAVPSGFYKRLGLKKNFSGKVRSLGSTALHASLVATGNLNAALIGRPKIWDIAASWSHLQSMDLDLYYCEDPTNYHSAEWRPLNLAYFQRKELESSRMLAGSFDDILELAKVINW